MLKQLEEIEKNMRQVLNEINSIGFNYEAILIDLWPDRKLMNFRIQLWDGNNHATNIKNNSCNFTSQGLIEWIERKKILFQKFEEVL
jgi:hypothetical protein